MGGPSLQQDGGADDEERCSGGVGERRGGANKAEGHDAVCGLSLS